MDSIFDKFIEIRPIVVEGEPEAHSVYLKVGAQSFCISPHGCDNKEHAEWLASMFKKALTNMFQECGALSAHQVVGGELSIRDKIKAWAAEQLDYLAYHKKEGQIVEAAIIAIKDLIVATNAGTFDTRSSTVAGGVVELQEKYEKAERGRIAAMDAALLMQRKYEACLETKAALSASPVAGWIAVSERLPDAICAFSHSSKAVLVWCQANLCHYTATYNHESKGWFHFGGGGYRIHYGPDHWMPLPPQPTTAEEGEGE